MIITHHSSNLLWFIRNPVQMHEESMEEATSYFFFSVHDIYCAKFLCILLMIKSA